MICPLENDDSQVFDEVRILKIIKTIDIEIFFALEIFIYGNIVYIVYTRVEGNVKMAYCFGIMLFSFIYCLVEEVKI